ncbi:hypothetical protein SD80_021100 [Scytonema tolypothrichoides VB-61278]|nr:hypothetical protein SD80_021100 [Scytonema tolypothrichoides VB-61278]
MFSSLSRRQLLKLISLMLGGTAVVGSAPFFGNFFATKAQAQETEEFVYKGRKYRIVTNQADRTASIDTTFDTSEQLFLDDKKVNITRNKETQKYLTPLLFGQFNSPHEVARRLIDQGIKFPISEVKLDPNVD